MRKIKELIAKGKLDQALLLLSEQYNSMEITQIQGRLNTLTQSKIMGELSYAEFSIERNKIRAATLGILGTLSEADLKIPSSAIKEQVLETEPPMEVSTRGKRTRNFIKEVTNIIEIEGTAQDFIPFKDLQQKVKILFISATPNHTRKLNIGKESRFKDLFRYFDREDIFEWKEEHGVDADEFFNFLIDEKPHILHYGGHGEVEGIILEKENLEGHILRDLLKISKQTQCVVLNACYSVTIAKKVAECVPYVIGTQGPLNDKSAIAFAKGFYMGIVAGNSIEEAFELGLIKIRQKKLPDVDIPILVKGVRKKED